MVPGEASTLSISFLFLYLFLLQFLFGYFGRRTIFSRVNSHSFFQSVPTASYHATTGSASWRTSSATTTSIASMVATNAAVVRISDNFQSVFEARSTLMLEISKTLVSVPLCGDPIIFPNCYRVINCSKNCIKESRSLQTLETIRFWISINTNVIPNLKLRTFPSKLQLI